MDGIGPGGPGGRDDRADIEQVECAVAVGAWHDRSDPESVARPRDPVRDLAAVGDEERADRGDGWPSAPAISAATNASIASLATRHRPPTRRAGSLPLTIQRWTDRVFAPIRAAA